MENLNRPVTRKKIKSVIKNLPTDNSPGPDGFTGKFCQIFKEKLILVLLKLIQKFGAKGVLCNSFYEASITLKSKPEKKRKLLANILDEYRCKNPQQNTSRPNSTAH